MDEVAAASIRCAEHPPLHCRITGASPPFQETSEASVGATPGGVPRRERGGTDEFFLARAHEGRLLTEPTWRLREQQQTMANRGVSADQDPIFVSKIRQKENKMFAPPCPPLARIHCACCFARRRRRRKPP
jgi:hypothetical protein